MAYTKIPYCKIYSIFLSVCLYDFLVEIKLTILNCVP